MNIPAKIRVGTRASALAMNQTRTIMGWISRANPALSFEIVEITTHGDRFGDVPIAEMGDRIERGIFNTALEEAVLEDRVDFATCSFKDVESDLPAGLTAESVGVREDPRDVLVTKPGPERVASLEELPPGAVLATSSPRRTSQLKAYRNDLRFEPLRGNITTRVENAVQRYDGIVLAAAGLLRLDLTHHIAEWIDTEKLLPAAAQAALGCEYLTARDDIAQLIAAIQDADTETCVRAEKSLMIQLSGGCYAPIGVLAEIRNGAFSIACRVVSADGSEIVAAKEAGDPGDASKITEALAQRMIDGGAREIIDRTRAELLQSQ